MRFTFGRDPGILWFHLTVRVPESGLLFCRLPTMGTATVSRSRCGCPSEAGVAMQKAISEPHKIVITIFLHAGHAGLYFRGRGPSRCCQI